MHRHSPDQAHMKADCLNHKANSPQALQRSLQWARKVFASSETHRNEVIVDCCPSARFDFSKSILPQKLTWLHTRPWRDIRGLEALIALLETLESVQGEKDIIQHPIKGAPNKGISDSIGRTAGVRQHRSW